MTSLSIGQVERLLGVKAHVLRYWEDEFPLLRPAKDHSGRREYSTADIDLLLRIKHILYIKKYSIKDAKEELYRELASGSLEDRALLREARSELLALYFSLKKKSNT